jgi:oligosaccharide reducing-end xylanase
MRARYTLQFLMVFLLVFALIAGCTSSDAPPAQVGAFYSGEYRNLFAELLGKSDEQTQAKLDGAWEHLFYGNDNTQRVYYPVGDQMAYMEDISHGDARSEGSLLGWRRPTLPCEVA